MVLIDFEVIGDDAKLLARHFENVVLIDAQRRTHRFAGAEKGAPKSGICACCPASSNRIRRGTRLQAMGKHWRGELLRAFFCFSASQSSALQYQNARLAFMR